MPHPFQQSKIPLGAAGAIAGHVIAMPDVPPVCRQREHAVDVHSRQPCSDWQRQEAVGPPLFRVCSKGAALVQFCRLCQPSVGAHGRQPRSDRQRQETAGHLLVVFCNSIEISVPTHRGFMGRGFACTNGRHPLTGSSRNDRLCLLLCWQQPRL